MSMKKPEPEPRLGNSKPSWGSDSPKNSKGFLDESPLLSPKVSVPVATMFKTAGLAFSTMLAKSTSPESPDSLLGPVAGDGPGSGNDGLLSEEDRAALGAIAPAKMRPSMKAKAAATAAAIKSSCFFMNKGSIAQRRLATGVCPRRNYD